MVTPMFISGLADCHIPGLYGLVISERQSDELGMRRVFYAGPDCKLPIMDGADFAVKPHNHRQSIRLTPLFGSVHNVAVKLSQWGEMRLWCYRFGSALLSGCFELERM